MSPQVSTLEAQREAGKKLFVAMESELILTEDDVPGASLAGRSPSDLLLKELRRWLACRGASRGGRHAELVKR